MSLQELESQLEATTDPNLQISLLGSILAKAFGPKKTAFMKHLLQLYKS